MRRLIITKHQRRHERLHAARTARELIEREPHRARFWLEHFIDGELETIERAKERLKIYREELAPYAGQQLHPDDQRYRDDRRQMLSEQEAST